MPEVLFVDGCRNRKRMSVPDLRPEYLFPLPRPMLLTLQPPKFTPERIRFDVAVFRLTFRLKQPVYRYSHMEPR